MSGDARNDAPTVDEKAGASGEVPGVEVVWEGILPLKAGRMRLVIPADRFYLPRWEVFSSCGTKAPAWWSRVGSEEAARATVYLARRLAAVESEVAALVELFEQTQGEIIPVHNDEFFRASWVREAMRARAGLSERATK